MREVLGGPVSIAEARPPVPPLMNTLLLKDKKTGWDVLERAGVAEWLMRGP